MLLNEILDKPLDWKWKSKGGNEYWATFWTDIKNPRPETAFSVEIIRYEVGGEWEISFGDGKGRMGITKGGNEFKIFATVMDIVKDFIKRERPEEIQFSAKEGKRGNLYARMIKKFGPKLGYKLYYKDKVENDGGIGFSLRRK